MNYFTHNKFFTITFYQVNSNLNNMNFQWKNTISIKCAMYFNCLSYGSLSNNIDKKGFRTYENSGIKYRTTDT